MTNAFTNTAAKFAKRSENAVAEFVETVLIACPEMTEADARAILTVYQDNRMVKFDFQIGAYNVKHGAFLDADVLRNALAHSKEAA